MVRFSKLWENHPKIYGDNYPCKVGDAKAFDNQCAIRLGISLERSGVNTKSFTGLRCWYRHSPRHILRAQELANWLSKSYSGFHHVEKYSGSEAMSKIGSRSGIIFFKNFFGSGRQGDHIDLWNGSRLTDWKSWFIFKFLDGSKYTGSEEIWFWPIP